MAGIDCKVSLCSGMRSRVTSSVLMSHHCRQYCDKVCRGKRSKSQTVG
jgi:hypothetical protein